MWRTPLHPNVPDWRLTRTDILRPRSRQRRDRRETIGVRELGSVRHRIWPGVTLSGREPRAVLVSGDAAGADRGLHDLRQRRVPDVLAAVRGLDHLAVADVHDDVADRAVEEDQVAGLEAVHRHLLADLGLRGRGARQVLAGLFEGVLHEAG